jgi:hypothetical protein
VPVTCGCRICFALTAMHQGPQVRPSPDDRAGDSFERRHHRHAEGCRRPAPPLRGAGLQLFEWTKSAKKPWDDVIMLPLPLFHVYANLGVQPLAFVGPNPLSLVPNPRDLPDLLKTDRAGEASVLQRSADAVYGDAESSRCPQRARSACAASSCASRAPRPAWPRPSASSRRPRAPASSKATR